MFLFQKNIEQVLDFSLCEFFLKILARNRLTTTKSEQYAPLLKFFAAAVFGW